MGETPYLPLHQLLEPMQFFLSDQDSGCLNLEMHHLALALAKKTLDENSSRNAQKTPDHFKSETEFTLKNKQPGKWDLKWRTRYRIVHIEFNGHYLHIKNEATGKNPVL